MKKQISHDLSKDKAKKVINRAVEEYSAEYAQFKPEFKWTSDTAAKLSLNLFGKKIEADIILHDTSVEVDLTVPPAFKMFEGKALEAINTEVKKWLRKAKAGAI